MSAALPEFVPFSSIPRLRRECVITEKVDGTNAQVWISDDLQTVAAGSRNRWITPDDDNYGFARWVAEHADNLRSLGPGHHYGEWWGAGIQRRYGLTEKRFSLFNTSRWGEGGAQAEQKPSCCHVVPVLYRGPFSDAALDACVGLLRGGSKAAPGFMNPEGVIVYLSAYRQLYKYTLDGDGHKGAARAVAGSAP